MPASYRSSRFIHAFLLLLCWLGVGIPVSIAQSGSSLVEGTKQMFRVTAYYSPLPGQVKYLRGNYDAERRLNGNGTNGASGKAVYPGMLAAPKTYAFGTQIQLDGFGTGTVWDRGGAIVPAGERGQAYDRIDVWMGYGDEGLQRALQWGSRVVPGTILGKTGAKDTIDYLGMRKEIQSLDMGEIAKRRAGYVPTGGTMTVVSKPVVSKPMTKEAQLPVMGKDTTGQSVAVLQDALVKLGYLKKKPTSVYDQETIAAVFSFQKEKGLVKDEADIAAGYFGTATRQALVTALAKGERAPVKSVSTASSTAVQTSVVVASPSAPSVKTNSTKKDTPVRTTEPDHMIPEAKTSVTIPLPNVRKSSLDVYRPHPKAASAKYVPAFSGAVSWQ